MPYNNSNCSLTVCCIKEYDDDDDDDDDLTLALLTKISGPKYQRKCPPALARCLAFVTDKYYVDYI